MSRAESGSSSVQGAAAQVRDKVSEVASNIKDAATEQYENVKEGAAEYYRAGRDKAAEWESQIEEYVRERPIKSLLMAAGVGALLGILWKRL